MAVAAKNTEAGKVYRPTRDTSRAGCGECRADPGCRAARLPLVAKPRPAIQPDGTVHRSPAGDARTEEQGREAEAESDVIASAGSAADGGATSGIGTRETHVADPGVSSTDPSGIRRLTHMLYLVAATFGRTNNAMAMQDMLDDAHSWYRFAPTSWVICSNEQASVWVQRLSDLVKPGGTLFVTRLHPKDRQGWMSGEFWSWMSEHASHWNY